MNANTYPIIAAAIFLIGIVWTIFFKFRGGGKIKDGGGITLLLSLFFCVAFALTFESAGAISSSFALCMTLGVIWTKRDKFKLADFVPCVAVSFACAAGIWLVFERVFSLSLP